MSWERNYTVQPHELGCGKVREDLIDVQLYDGDWPPSDLVGAVAWLQAFLDKVPEEWRANVSFEIGSVGSWEDTHYPTIRIGWWRPETDDEWAARVATRRAEEANDKAQREANTRRLYAQLKARFEP